MAVCSEIHTKHINTMCGQNVELLNVKLAVHIVTTGLERAVMRAILTNAVGHCNILTSNSRPQCRQPCLGHSVSHVRRNSKVPVR